MSNLRTITVAYVTHESTFISRQPVAVHRPCEQPVSVAADACFWIRWLHGCESSIGIGERTAVRGRGIRGFTSPARQRGRYGRQTLGPESRVEPDVRVVRPVAAVAGHQLLLAQIRRDDDRLLPGLRPLQHVADLAFEVQAVVEDDLRVAEFANVAGRSRVAVRVDPRPHQALHADAVPTDLFDGIRDQARRADDRQLAVGIRRRGRAAEHRSRDQQAEEAKGICGFHVCSLI